MGTRLSFASALDWPGWSRSGPGDKAAVEALRAYAPRYSPVARGAGLEPPDSTQIEVVERLPGSGTTDFGVPGVIGPLDGEPLTAPEAARLVRLLESCWELFDRVVADAPASLRKGAPRWGAGPRRGRRPRCRRRGGGVHTEAGDPAPAAGMGRPGRTGRGARRHCGRAAGGGRGSAFGALGEGVAGALRRPPDRLARARSHLGDRGPRCLKSPFLGVLHGSTPGCAGSRAVGIRGAANPLRTSASRTTLEGERCWIGLAAMGRPVARSTQRGVTSPGGFPSTRSRRTAQWSRPRSRLRAVGSVAPPGALPRAGRG